MIAPLDETDWRLEVVLVLVEVIDDNPPVGGVGEETLLLPPRPPAAEAFVAAKSISIAAPLIILFMPGLYRRRSLPRNQGCVRTLTHAPSPNPLLTMLPQSPHVRVILNSRSGWHFKPRYDAAVARLVAAGWCCDICRPSSIEETRALGADPAGYDATLISGGDGTISVFLQDAPLERTVIGLLPGGTANVVARDLLLPVDPRQAAEVMLRRHVCEMDVGEARWPDGTRRRFILSCSSGSIARAVADVSSGLKKVTGQGAYAVSFLKAIVTRQSAVVRVNDEEFDAAPAIALLTRHYAGGFVPAPSAPRGDGLFDIFILDGRLVSYAGFTLGGLRKFWPLSRLARHMKADSMSILTKGPLEMDGDPVPDSPVELSLAGKVLMFSS